MTDYLLTELDDIDASEDIEHESGTFDPAKDREWFPYRTKMASNFLFQMLDRLNHTELIYRCFYSTQLIICPAFEYPTR